MGKVTLNPSFESFKGKLGDIIFSKLGDINVYRRKPDNPKNPRTPAQVAVRSALSETVQFLRPFLRAIRIGFAQAATAQRAKAQSPWTLAVKANLQTLRDQGELNADNLQLTPGLTDYAATAVAGRGSSIDISWTPPTTDDLADSTAYFVFFDATTGRSLLSSAPASQGTASLDLTTVRNSDTDETAAWFFLVADNTTTKTIRIL